MPAQSKVSKTLPRPCPGLRQGSDCPRSGIAPWAAAMSHPWPGAANSASMPGCPLRNTCARPATSRNVCRPYVLRTPPTSKAAWEKPRRPDAALSRSKHRICGTPPRRPTKKHFNSSSYLLFDESQEGNHPEKICFADFLKSCVPNTQITNRATIPLRSTASLDNSWLAALVWLAPAAD
ncbi:Uncharacterised protein [Paucimonas lemoignei]|nr:Uncharacterised protein [Paucimonas lemoignei]